MNGGFAVSSNIGVHVDDHRTGFEIRNRSCWDGDGCGATENPCGCDDDVSICGDATNRVVHLLDELGRQRFCVPRFVLEIVHAVNFNEATTDGFNLFSR